MRKRMHVCATLAYIEDRAKGGTSLLADKGRDLSPAEVIAEIAALRGEHPGLRYYPPCPEAWNTEDGHCPGHPVEVVIAQGH